MTKAIKKVLASLNIRPVLLDIGASGAPPEIWNPIAEKSVYVGFDPDRRELHEVKDGKFARSIIVNEAVTHLSGMDEVSFYLTQLPTCSSTLKPDAASLENYLFADKFIVTKETAVRATSLSGVLTRLDLPGIDWFKADSQGTDLRLFQSLPEDIRGRVLAVDVEPGLMDVYQGEDLFADTHRELVRQGFWTSSMKVLGSVRMKQDTIRDLKDKGTPLTESYIGQSVRSSPGWCEARYLRTIESLAARNAAERDYVLLWVFAMIDQQWGFALDIASAYERLFGQNSIGGELYRLPLKKINAPGLRFRAAAKQLIPLRLKRFVKQALER